jgi:DNA-binding HxlR family transcriptional regulator
MGSNVRPLVESFDRIGSPWRLVVLDSLYGEEMRFNELKRSTGANTSTLARVLDNLEDDGLVERRIEEASPVATYYRLTEKGKALKPVIRSLTEWAEEWLPEPAETLDP